MSTVAIKQTPIEAKWPIEKTRQAAALAFATNCMAARTVISKQGEKAEKEYQDIIHKYQLEHFKSIGVKTPLDLVRAKAEFETNVFGSKIEIEGDENNAQLIYKQCAIWEAMQKLGCVTPENQEKIGKNFESCLQDFAKEFGFNAEVKFDNNEATVTFKK
jgi:hypothetical protein